MFNEKLGLLLVEASDGKFFLAIPGALHPVYQTIMTVWVLGKGARAISVSMVRQFVSHSLN